MLSLGSVSSPLSGDGPSQSKEADAPMEQSKPAEREFEADNKSDHSMSSSESNISEQITKQYRPIEVA